MTFAPPDRDDPAQDASRLRAVNRQVCELTIRALMQVRMPVGPGDRFHRARLRRCDLDAISDADVAWMRRLAWRYRRQMPRHLVPLMNPDDPIVREIGLRAMETTHGR